MKCDVCGKNNASYVVASTYGPESFAYCEECLLKGREPYGAIVNYIASACHFPDDISIEYQVDVRRQLKLYGISEEQFIQDVEKVINNESWQKEQLL